MFYTRDKIGFVVPNLGPAQLNYYLIQNSIKYKDFDSIFFYEEVDRSPIDLMGASMHVTELWSFDGPAIATNLSTANKLINSTSPHPKYFYVWDLEWIRFPRKNYHALYGIYGNQDLILISRTEEHKKLIENCWNKKVKFVIDNGNFLNNQEFLSHAKKNTFPVYG